MQQWLRECQTENKTITDAAIREKAKSLVPDLVLMGTFKASAGWLDNFKQRNGIRQGRWEGLGTRAKDERAVGFLSMAQKRAEQIVVSGELPPNWAKQMVEEAAVLLEKERGTKDADGTDAAAASGSNPTAGADATGVDSDLRTTETPATDGDVEMSEDSQLQTEPSGASTEPSSEPSEDVASGAAPATDTGPASTDEPMAVTQDPDDPSTAAPTDHTNGNDEAQPYMYSDDTTVGDFRPNEDSSAGAGPSDGALYEEHFVVAQEPGPIDPSTGQPIATIENAAALVASWMRGLSTVFNAEERKVIQKVHNVIVDMGTTGIADPGRFT